MLKITGDMQGQTRIVPRQQPRGFQNQTPNQYHDSHPSFLIRSSSCALRLRELPGRTEATAQGTPFTEAGGRGNHANGDCTRKTEISLGRTLPLGSLSCLLLDCQQIMLSGWVRSNHYPTSRKGTWLIGHTILMRLLEFCMTISKDLVNPCCFYCMGLTPTAINMQNQRSLRVRISLRRI